MTVLIVLLMILVFVQDVQNANPLCDRNPCEGPKFSQSSCCESHVCVSGDTDGQLVCVDAKERLRVVTLEDMLKTTDTGSNFPTEYGTQYDQNTKMTDTGNNFPTEYGTQYDQNIKTSDTGSNFPTEYGTQYDQNIKTSDTGSNFPTEYGTQYDQNIKTSDTGRNFATHDGTQYDNNVKTTDTENKFGTEEGTQYNFDQISEQNGLKGHVGRKRRENEMSSYKTDEQGRRFAIRRNLPVGLIDN